MFQLTKPLYPLLLSLAKKDPEKAHLQLLKILTAIESSNDTNWGKFFDRQLQNNFSLKDPRLEQTLWGLNFPNPFGLAAGFDKNGTAAGIWSSFGFGFAELGAVTLHSQSGNPKPRMFRLSEDKAALNRMGANNLGALVMKETLREIWQRKARNIPIGINLCKSKITRNEEAAKDYVGSFNLLEDVADYFVVNVSSPNTPGLRNLQAGEQLKPILSELQEANKNNKPILIKISPDLNWEDIKTILDLAKTYELAGAIATNTTISRDNLKTNILKATGKAIKEETGGISGQPIKERSTEIIRFIYRETNGSLPIIGVGGIFSAEDAWEKIIAGASLLQVYTGFVYQGAWIVKDVLSGILNKLDDSNLSNINEAVGFDRVISNK